MNFEFFISKRLLKPAKATFSKPIVRISVTGISLGVAVMIVAMAVLFGFKSAIKDKLTGFSSHVVIGKYNASSMYDELPIKLRSGQIDTLKSIIGVRHIQGVVNKSGIMKTEGQIEGILLKGIDSNFDWSFFNDKIISGSAISVNDSSTSKEILISKTIASKLFLDTNDRVSVYFIQNPPRARRFTIKGIYETGMEDFDKKVIIADIKHLRKLNGWKNKEVASYEVFVNDIDDVDRISARINYHLDYDMYSKTIEELFPHIFDWLRLQDMNVFIILLLMIIVSIITIISILLILILERTTMIGLFKAFGTSNSSIRKIFIYNASFIIGKGMLWGNIIGLSLCFLQYYFDIFTLDKDSYYMSVVPIKISVMQIVILNIITLIVCVLSMILPSAIVSKVTPVKAINYK